MTLRVERCALRVVAEEGTGDEVGATRAASFGGDVGFTFPSPCHTIQEMATASEALMVSTIMCFFAMDHTYPYVRLAKNHSLTIREALTICLTEVSL
jgi:hypothetical protein